MLAGDNKNRAGVVAAGMLALALAACDSGNVVDTGQGAHSEELKSILDTAPETAGAHQPNDPHASLGAEQLARVALQHLDEGRAELAEETLNDALRRHPGSLMLLSVRASLFLQAGRTSLALADLNQAIELNPHDPILLTNRAQAYRQFGRNDEARRDLDNAIELDPAFIGAIFNRGSLHFEAESYDLALLDFNRCIELGPDVPAAYFNRASTHEALGDRDSAISDLRHFLTLSPEESWARVARDMLQQWNPGQS